MHRPYQKSIKNVNVIKFEIKRIKEKKLGDWARSLQYTCTHYLWSLFHKYPRLVCTTCVHHDDYICNSKTGVSDRIIMWSTRALAFTWVAVFFLSVVHYVFKIESKSKMEFITQLMYIKYVRAMCVVRCAVFIMKFISNVRLSFFFYQKPINHDSRRQTYVLQASGNAKKTKTKHRKKSWCFHWNVRGTAHCSYKFVQTHAFVSVYAYSKCILSIFDYKYPNQKCFYSTQSSCIWISNLSANDSREKK